MSNIADATSNSSNSSTPFEEGIEQTPFRIRRRDAEDEEAREDSNILNQSSLSASSAPVVVFPTSMRIHPEG